MVGGLASTSVRFLGASTRGLFSLTVPAVYAFQTFTFINYPPAVPHREPNWTFPFFAFTSPVKTFSCSNSFPRLLHRDEEEDRRFSLFPPPPSFLRLVSHSIPFFCGANEIARRRHSGRLIPLFSEYDALLSTTLEFLRVKFQTLAADAVHRPQSFCLLVPR